MFDRQPVAQNKGYAYHNCHLKVSSVLKLGITRACKECGRVSQLRYCLVDGEESRYWGAPDASTLLDILHPTQ